MEEKRLFKYDERFDYKKSHKITDFKEVDHTKKEYTVVYFDGEKRFKEKVMM